MDGAWCHGAVWYRPPVRRLLPLLASLPLVACVDYGVTRSQRLDVWTQPDRDDSVDLLWVLDNSGSMAEEHESLAEHAAAFTNTLAAADLEFRLGLVNTDPADAGDMLGPPLDQDTEELTTFFIAQVQGTGIRGDRDEQGFEAALTGGSPDVTPDFARASANLEVIVYSDEDDHTDLDVGDFLDELALTHPGMQVRVNAIVGDEPSGCANSVAAADAGERYHSATEASGGVRESICTNDMDAMLTRVANRVIGLNSVFALSDLPLLNTMTVQVDGVAIPRRDIDGWRYDGVTNSLIFSGWAIPRPGATVQASYFNWTGGPLPDTGVAQ